MEKQQLPKQETSDRQLLPAPQWDTKFEGSPTLSAEGKLSLSTRMQPNFGEIAKEVSDNVEYAQRVLQWVMHIARANAAGNVFASKPEHPLTVEMTTLLGSVNIATRLLKIVSCSMKVATEHACKGVNSNGQELNVFVKPMVEQDFDLYEARMEKLTKESDKQEKETKQAAAPTRSATRATETADSAAPAT